MKVLKAFAMLLLSMVREYRQFKSKYMEDLRVRRELDRILLGAPSSRVQLLDELERATTYSRDEILTFEQRLQLPLKDMLAFYLKFKCMPSTGLAIGIRHFGVETVIECVNEIVKLQKFIE
jgi:hypothetical protein